MREFTILTSGTIRTLFIVKLGDNKMEENSQLDVGDAAQPMADLRVSDAHQGAYDEMTMCTDFEQDMSFGQVHESLPLPTEEAGT